MHMHIYVTAFIQIQINANFIKCTWDITVCSQNINFRLKINIDINRVTSDCPGENFIQDPFQDPDW